VLKYLDLLKKFTFFKLSKMDNITKEIAKIRKQKTILSQNKIARGFLRNFLIKSTKKILKM